MAIDWGRMAMGIGTGYLGAKIANTEANDKLNANIIEQAGLNFYTNTLPAHQKTEKMIEKEFKQVASMWGQDFANAKNIDKSFFKDKKFSTFAERKAIRTGDIQNREKTIMGLTSGSSKIGNMTAELLVDGGKEIPTEPTTATETVTTPAVEGSQVGPVITEAVPEKTETKEIPLPTYEEIFGDTGKAETVYLKMDREDKNI